MNKIIIHEAKSKYAYMYDENTLHLRLKTLKNTVKTIRLIYGDPFNWEPSKQDPKIWEWHNRNDSDIYLKKEYCTNDFDHYFCEITPHFKRAKYAFVIDEEYIFGCHGLKSLLKNPKEISKISNFFTFPYLNEEDTFNAPQWVQNQVWYSIFTDRFNNDSMEDSNELIKEWNNTVHTFDDKSFGGSLSGVLNKLDYISELGFTGIYFTPLFKAMSPHKYDTVDYFNIDKQFGSNDEMKKIINKAHELGIKVMLDAVFNHVGIEHPYFLDVIQNGTESKYFDCFYILDRSKPIVDFKIDGINIDQNTQDKLLKNPELLNYRAFGFTPLMPKINTSNPLMRSYLLDIAKFWIQEFDIDGWRLDVSNEVSHDFWRQFRASVKSIKKDILIVGENWDNSLPWLYGDQHDSTMNYEILHPIWEYFGTNIIENNISTQEFVEQISKILTDYPKNVLKVLYNLVESHDTARIYSICGNDIELTKLPYVFMFSFPGTPSVFYGGEVPLEGENVPQNRYPMIWEKVTSDNPMSKFLKRLIAIRKEYEGFKSPDFEWLHVNNDNKTLIYKKGDLYFLINNNPESKTITLPKELQNCEYFDIFDQELINLSESIELGKYNFRILK